MACGVTVIMRESNGCLPGSVIRGSSVPFCFRYFYIKVSTSKRQNSWSWRVKVEETTCMLIVENSLPFHGAFVVWTINNINNYLLIYLTFVFHPSTALFFY